ncbi:hypothetical protein JOF53_006567 [Crossiella equi]|uniref:DUF4192 domain-containing protein n=1 Tax=Crossiella equi TaxID=130796 RepID=A0ABS5AMB8_9PSEU|nr:DUF4192 family protein [Crossiella equi]MBP2477695.1 hypothetical protein [Crossiella equi]
MNNDETSALIHNAPGVLGFNPRNAVVLLPYEPDPGAKLPDSATALLADLSTLIGGGGPSAGLTEAVRELNWKGCFILVICDQTVGEIYAPHRPLIDRIATCLRLDGLAVACAVWVAEIRPGRIWLRYRLRGDLGATEAANGARLADDGHDRPDLPFESVEEIERLLCPSDKDTMLLREAVSADLLAAEPVLRTKTSLCAAVTHLREAVTAARPGTGSLLTRQQYVALTRALDDVIVWGTSLRWAFEAEYRDQAVWVWLQLTRVLHGPHRAKVATLLAITAALAGSHQVASIAARIASESGASPHGHQIARDLQYGVLPAPGLSGVRSILTEAQKDYELICDEQL